MVSALAVALIGCDQAKKFADSVQENVSGGADKTATEGSAIAPPTEQPSPATTTDAIPAVPNLPIPKPAEDPQILLAAFLATPPNGFQDSTFDVLSKLPPDALESIESVSIASANVSPVGLEKLTLCPHLKTLKLEQMTLTDEMFECVVRLETLESLSLLSSQFSDSSLQRISVLKGLKELNLSSTPITDAGIVLLPALSNLEVLNLSGTQAIGATLQNKPRLVHLRQLDLTRSKLSVGLSYFKGAPELEELIGIQAAINDQALQQSGDWPKLKKLVLNACDVSDLGMKFGIGRSKALEHVELHATRVGNPTLGLLRFCKDLKYVNVTETKVDQNAAAALKKILPDLEIHW